MVWPIDVLASLNEEASRKQSKAPARRPRLVCEDLDGDEPILGYMLAFDAISGSLFAGITPAEVAETVCYELEAQQDCALDAGTLRLTPIMVTCNEINSMPEHEGW